MWKEKKWIRGISMPEMQLLMFSFARVRFMLCCNCSVKMSMQLPSPNNCHMQPKKKRVENHMRIASLSAGNKCTWLVPKTHQLITINSRRPRSYTWFTNFEIIKGAWNFYFCARWTSRSRSRICLNFGALIVVVGLGNVTLMPFLKSIGWYSSGTSGCITGELR